MFDAIDPNPLGSASLAQVHRARLVTGEEVAVKVQRPGAQQVMAQDIDIIRSVVRIVSKFVNTDQFVDLHGVV
ncbi:AarF/UbiB family protein, partial [Salmonella enterica]|uniref:AarF/UbiB family protein n=1 Tax=Salmonella enterica TaxID=28901 RepID=UPI003CEF4AF5